MTKRNIIKGMHRHGDVGLIPVKCQPPKDAEHRAELILAYGEVTGHRHRLVGEIVTWIGPSLLPLRKGEDARFIQVLHRPAQLDHEEHGLQIVQPAVEPDDAYEVPIHREWELSGEFRAVAD